MLQNEINHDPSSRHTPSYTKTATLCPRHDTPAADSVVGVTSKQSLTVGAPGQGHALGLPALLANLHILGLELVDLALLLQIEDDDARGGGSAQPVAVWRENEGVDLVTGGERVKVLGLVEIPEHGGSVLATGGAQGTIGRDSDSVDVTGVTDVVGLDAAGSEFPDLKLVSFLSKRCNCIGFEQNPQNQGLGDCFSHSTKALK